jgi:hypothetical protein
MTEFEQTEEEMHGTGSAGESREVYGTTPLPCREMSHGTIIPDLLMAAIACNL